MGLRFEARDLGRTLWFVDCKDGIFTINEKPGPGSVGTRLNITLAQRMVRDNPGQYILRITFPPRPQDLEG